MAENIKIVRFNEDDSVIENKTKKQGNFFFDLSDIPSEIWKENFDNEIEHLNKTSLQVLNTIFKGNQLIIEDITVEDMERSSKLLKDIIEKTNNMSRSEYEKTILKELGEKLKFD